MQNFRKGLCSGWTRRLSMFCDTEGVKMLFVKDNCGESKILFERVISHDLLRNTQITSFAGRPLNHTLTEYLVSQVDK